MAGKVAQIQSQLNTENLARQLSSLYNTWWIQRQPKEAEWKELRNYLFATDTTKTTNSKAPWKNKTTLPKLTQLRDNLHANYMDALFPNDDWLKWEGYSKTAVVKKKRVAIEAYMKNKLREGGFREFISKALYDYIDYGNVFGEAIYVTEKAKDPTTGEMVDIYTGPKAIRISPHDHIFNPVAATYSSTPKFTRYMKSIGELKKDIDSRPGLQYNTETFNKIISLRKQMSDFRMEDIAKAEGYFIDGFGSLKEYYQSGLVEILEFEGDVFDNTTGELKENRIITIADRKYILRDIENPSWLGQDSKVHVAWRERPDNLYGMGPLDNLVGLQYRIDHLENNKADAMDLTIHPPKVIKGDVEPFEWAPGVDIHVPEDGDVTQLAPNAAAFQVNNEIGYLLALMEEMAGAPKEAMGVRTPGEKTAFEVQQLQNAAGRIFQNKINKFEIEFLEPLINKMLELAKRHLDVKDIARVVDDDLGVASFIEITKEDITAKGILRPMGARHYAARAQLMQNLNGIFNGPIGQMIAPHVSSKELAKMVEEYMGLERFKFIKDNAAVFEGKETQRLMNQATSQLESEAAVPIEENMVGTA
ncbi:MAG: hypothetical protein WC471_06105 [Candidatus Woesearchaeota archaeon]|jgi:hypothetical protein